MRKCSPSPELRSSQVAASATSHLLEACLAAFALMNAMDSVCCLLNLAFVP